MWWWVLGATGKALLASAAPAKHKKRSRPRTRCPGGVGSRSAAWAVLGEWSPSSGSSTPGVVERDEPLDVGEVELSVVVQVGAGGAVARDAGLNNDGEFDFADIERFISLYNAGC